MKNVACFFTGGYTESNSMLSFLSKINDNLNFNQMCPNRTKRRKVRGDVESVTERNLIGNVSGLTGASLTKYVYKYLDDYQAEIKSYDAIIIEDDLDGSFFEIGSDGFKKSSKNAEFINHCAQIRENIIQRMGKGTDFPVILFYAAPEIESWILSDWNNSFGYVYGPKEFQYLTSDENRYFSARFQPYIKENVLGEYNTCIEKYGYIDNQYYKLSDKLITSVQQFKVFLSDSDNNEELPKAIAQNQRLLYSKKIHGDKMLLHISPEKVKEKCPLYFAEAFDAIKNL